MFSQQAIPTIRDCLCFLMCASIREEKLNLAFTWPCVLNHQIHQKPWETIDSLWLTPVGLVSLDHPSFSCSLWQAASRIWTGFPGIALLVVTGLKHSHLFSLFPNVFPRGLVICHKLSYVNLTPLAEPSASFISRKASGTADHPVPLSSHRVVLCSALGQMS